jgi:signal transduction histidine kinase
MDLGRPTVRLFVLAVAAALPPLILAAVALAEPPWLFRFGTGTALLVFLLLTGAWAAVVTVLGSRGLSADVAAILELARRGRSVPGGSGAEGDGAITSPGGAYERLAVMLEERNRQIGELAAALRAAPIQSDVREVARATVRGAIIVTRDPTWTLAVLRSPRPAALPVGIYAADQAGVAHELDPGPITEVAGWAATVAPDEPGLDAVRHAIGPWGAFVVVEVAAGDELRASLLAPWEGRAAPSGSERELLSLLGQNAAIAIEHALLVEQLRSQTEELNRMAVVQSDFLRGVTHDLQTPLTSIRAVASELTSEPALSDAARADLATIGHQADRLRRMVAQLLVASRLEVGELQPRQEVFRLEPIVQRTWDALRAARPFRLEVSGVPHLTVADPDRLEQVLWALLDNAVKYSPPGSPVSVELCGEEADGGGLRSEIRIRDEGTGMDEETVRRAFEQFYRSDQARRLAPDGSGVGLYAARGLVDAMGGSINIESRLGSGTTMALQLPAEALEEPVPGH